MVKIIVAIITKTADPLIPPLYNHPKTVRMYIKRIKRNLEVLNNPLKLLSHRSIIPTAEEPKNINGNQIGGSTKKV